MSFSNEATATYEFIVELHKFYNVDLFLRGSYQVQVQLRAHTKLQSRIEVSVNKSKTTSHHGHGSNHAHSLAPPPPTCATSKKFRVLFKSEEIDLNQVVLFRVYINLDSKYLSELTKIEFKLELKLMFNENPVSRRELDFNLDKWMISYYRPIFFDYFHLCAVGIGVHGGCIAVHLVKGLSSFDGSSCSASTTSSPTSCVSNSSNATNRLTRTHAQLIKILIEANTALQTALHWQSSSSRCSESSGHPENEKLEDSCPPKEPRICNIAVGMNGVDPMADSEETLILASKQMSQLCAENILTWHKFLDSVVGKEDVRRKLANEHHMERVRRWTEGFYVTKNPVRSIYTPKDYTPIVDLLKKTIQYKPLALHCQELDGDGSTIPIIFEDQFGGDDSSSCSCGGKIEPPSTIPEEEKIVPAPPAAHPKTTRRESVTSAKLTLSVKGQQNGHGHGHGHAPGHNHYGTLNGSKSSAVITTETVDAVATLPRRHSSSSRMAKVRHQSHPPLNIRKYSSTPTLINDEEGTSEESGWVSDQSSEGEFRWSSDEENNVVEFVPPPAMFRDDPPQPPGRVKINGRMKMPIPPKEVSLDRDLFGALDVAPPKGKSMERSKTKYGSVQDRKSKITTTENGEQKRRSSHPPSYFQIPDELRVFHPMGLHLIICVHGLDGSCHDLRLFKVYLELSLPGMNMIFLMSEKNQDGLTFSDFSSTTDAFVDEVLNFIECNKLNPIRISFVGHSLGCIIIRSALTKPKMKPLLPKLHTFLSLSGPHLGTCYNGAVVSCGMWLMQKWKKSTSLLQLSLKDHPDYKETFMYKLSLNSNLQHFKYILLCGSSQDRYVPLHSAHIINCKASLRDQSVLGPAYRGMVTNILHPLLKSNTKLVRYDVHHAIPPHSANSIIGRAAHIAVLDSEIFIEKFISVSGVKFFG